jgi:hypothetical protein
MVASTTTNLPRAPTITILTTQLLGSKQADKHRHALIKPHNHSLITPLNPKSTQAQTLLIKPIVDFQLGIFESPADSKARAGQENGT